MKLKLGLITVLLLALIAHKGLRLENEKVETITFPPFVSQTYKRK
jgi:hypothetical protein